MRLEKALLVAVLWPAVACAEQPVASPRPAPPLAGFSGFSSSGPDRTSAHPVAPIPDAKGNAGPAAIEKTKLLDPPRPPPSPGVMLP